MSDEVRVVITGVGPVSPIGIGREEYCKSLLSGVSGAAEIESFDTTGFDHSIACEVKDLPGDEHVGRASQFALKAAQLAIEDAGISIDYIRGVPTAIYMGTTDGESQILDVFSSNFCIMRLRIRGRRSGRFHLIYRRQLLGRLTFMMSS